MVRFSIVCCIFLLVGCGKDTARNNSNASTNNTGTNQSNNGSNNHSNNTNNTSTNNTSTNNTSTNNPVEPIEREDAAAAVAQVLCAGQTQCGCLPAGVDEDGCAQTAAALWDAHTTEVSGGTYDGACLRRHLDAAEAAECAPMPFDPQFAVACYEGVACQIFAGSKQEGESCTGAYRAFSDCAPGLACYRGTCVEPCMVATGLTVGDRCEFDTIESADLDRYIDRCTDDAYCDLSTGPRGASSCAAKKSAGEACERLAGGQNLAECQPDLECINDVDGGGAQRICQALRAEGETCLFGFDCASGHCDVEQGAGRVCQPTPAAGEPCTWRCIDATCVPEDATTNRCAALPGAAEPCLTNRVDRTAPTCGGDLACDPISGLCQPSPGLAQACTPGGVPCAQEGPDPIICRCEGAGGCPDPTCQPHPIAICAGGSLFGFEL